MFFNLSCAVISSEKTLLWPSSYPIHNVIKANKLAPNQDTALRSLWVRVRQLAFPVQRAYLSINQACDMWARRNVTIQIVAMLHIPTSNWFTTPRIIHFHVTVTTSDRLTQNATHAYIEMEKEFHWVKLSKRSVFSSSMKINLLTIA